jgi:hypothetical protein
MQLNMALLLELRRGVCCGCAHQDVHELKRVAALSLPLSGQHCKAMHVLLAVSMLLMRQMSCDCHTPER